MHPRKKKKAKRRNNLGMKIDFLKKIFYSFIYAFFYLTYSHSCEIKDLSNILQGSWTIICCYNRAIVTIFIIDPITTTFSLARDAVGRLYGKACYSLHYIINYVKSLFLFIAHDSICKFTYRAKFCTCFDMISSENIYEKSVCHRH